MVKKNAVPVISLSLHHRSNTIQQEIANDAIIL